MGTKITITLDKQYEFKGIPSETEFIAWVNQAVNGVNSHLGMIIKEASIAIAIVDKSEMRRLNTHYRHKKGATNTLSFPYTVPSLKMPQLSGDIALCAPVIEEEARAQAKLPEAHWAHITIHSVLHLCGYDHIKEEDAKRMETLESTLLKQLGFPDPYMEHKL